MFETEQSFSDLTDRPMPRAINWLVNNYTETRSWVFQPPVPCCCHILPPKSRVTHRQGTHITFLAGFMIMPACANNVVLCPSMSSNCLPLVGHAFRTFYINPVKILRMSLLRNILLNPMLSHSISHLWPKHFHPGELLLLELTYITSRVPDSVNLGWGLVICISKKLPDANATPLGSHFENHCTGLTGFFFPGQLSNYSKKELRLSAELCSS